MELGPISLSDKSRGRGGDDAPCLEIGPLSDGYHASSAAIDGGANESSDARTAEESLWAYIVRRTNDILANSLPPQTKADVHDLRKTGKAQFISLSFFITYVVTLVYLTVTQYNQLREEAFLSPDIYSGECDEESISLTSVYAADISGNWETETNFVSTNSIYSLKLTGSEIPSTEYSRIMRDFGDQFEAMGLKCTQRDLSYCMLVLANYNLLDNATNMNFRADARAEKIYGNLIYDAKISDMYDNCKTKNGSFPRSYYDEGTNEIVFNVYFGDSESGEPCEQLNRKDFNTRALDALGYLDIAFDIRSVSVAVAINLGITTVKDDLVRLPFPNGKYNSEGEFIPTSPTIFNRYVDPAYYGMDPILCFDGSSQKRPDFCLLEDDTDYGMYPMITQFGNWTDGTPCRCGENGLQDKTMSYYCSFLDFLVSIIYIPSQHWDYYDIIDLAYDLNYYRLQDPVDGDLKVAELVHAAQIDSLGNRSYASVNGSDPFLDLCNGFCTLFTVNLYGWGAKAMNFRGTPAYEMYENTEMRACANGAYRADAFNALVEEPPVPLIQGYYTCVLNSTAAMQRAVGIAAGSAGLYSSIVLNFFLFTSVFIYNRFSPSKMKSAAEKKKILEEDVSRLMRDVQIMAAEIRELKKAQSGMVDSTADGK